MATFEKRDIASLDLSCSPYNISVMIPFSAIIERGKSTACKFSLSAGVYSPLPIYCSRKLAKLHSSGFALIFLVGFNILKTDHKGEYLIEF